MKKLLQAILRLLRIKFNKSADFLSEYVSIKEEINEFLSNYKQASLNLDKMSINLRTSNEKLDLQMKEQLLTLSRVIAGIDIAVKQDNEVDAKHLIIQKSELENQINLFKERKDVLLENIKIVDLKISENKSKIQTLENELEILHFEYEQAMLNKQLNVLLYTNTNSTSTLKSIKERVQKTKAEDAGLQAHINKHEKSTLDSLTNSAIKINADEEYKRLRENMSKKDI